MNASTAVLLVAFIVELCSGLFFLLISLLRLPSSTIADKSRFYMKSQATSKLQLVLMSCVNIFSGVGCFMKVVLNIANMDSQWVDYLQWVVCTPAIIVTLCLVCSVDAETTVALAFLDAVMIICSYLGFVFDEPTIKWAWFALGLFFFLILFTTLLSKKRQISKTAEAALMQATKSRRQSQIPAESELALWCMAIQEENDLSSRLIILTISTWSIYPMIWILEATEVITGPNADIIHSVLAGAAKVSFGFVLAFYRWRMGLDMSSNFGIKLLPLQPVLSRERLNSVGNFLDLAVASPHTAATMMKTPSAQSLSSPDVITPASPSSPSLARANSDLRRRASLSDVVRGRGSTLNLDADGADVVPPLTGDAES